MLYQKWKRISDLLYEENGNLSGDVNHDKISRIVNEKLFLLSRLQNDKNTWEFFRQIIVSMTL